MPESIFSNPFGLAAITSLVILFIFGIAFLISVFSKVWKTRVQLVESARIIQSAGKINAATVDVVYSELSKFPEPAVKGWAEFMDKHRSYPSDYMLAQDVFADKMFRASGAVGKVFMLIGGFVAIMAAVLFAAVNLADESVSLLAVIGIPVAVYAVCVVLVYFWYERLVKRLHLAYASFQDILDENFIVPLTADEGVFTSGGMKKLYETADGIFGGDTDFESVITAPKISGFEFLTLEEVNYVKNESADAELNDTSENTDEAVVEEISEQHIMQSAEETELKSTDESGETAETVGENDKAGGENA